MVRPQLERRAAAEELLAPSDLLTLPLRGAGDECLRCARRLDPFGVQVRLAAFGHGADCELGILRSAELAGDDDVEWKLEATRNLGRGRHSTARQPEDDRVLPAAVTSEPRGKQPAGLQPIAEATAAEHMAFIEISAPRRSARDGVQRRHTSTAPVHGLYLFASIATLFDAVFFGAGIVISKTPLSKLAGGHEHGALFFRRAMAFVCCKSETRGRRRQVGATFPELITIVGWNRGTENSVVVTDPRGAAGVLGRRLVRGGTIVGSIEGG